MCAASERGLDGSVLPLCVIASFCFLGLISGLAYAHEERRMARSFPFCLEEKFVLVQVTVRVSFLPGHLAGMVCRVNTVSPFYGSAK